MIKVSVSEQADRQLYTIESARFGADPNPISETYPTGWDCGELESIRR